MPQTDQQWTVWPQTFAEAARARGDQLPRRQLCCVSIPQGQHADNNDHRVIVTVNSALSMAAVRALGASISLYSCNSDCQCDCILVI